MVSAWRAAEEGVLNGEVRGFCLLHAFGRSFVAGRKESWLDNVPARPSELKGRVLDYLLMLDFVFAWFAWLFLVSRP